MASTIKSRIRACCASACIALVASGAAIWTAGCGDSNAAADAAADVDASTSADVDASTSADVDASAAADASTATDAGTGADASVGADAGADADITGNTAPTAASQSVSLDEDASLAITLTGTDPDSGAMQIYSIVAMPLNGNLTGTAPVLTYTPDTDYFGADSFTFKINDGSDDSNTATVSITVSDTYQWTNISNDAGFITAVAFDPSDSNKVWVSGDDGGGLYLRSNPAASFLLQDTAPVNWSAYALGVDPSNGDIVYAPNHFGRGLAKTTDGGATWNVVGAGLPSGDPAKRVNDFALDPASPSTMYACTDGGLYKSVDSGATFSKISSGTFAGSEIFRAVAISNEMTPRVFIGADDGAVYASADSGTTWSVIIPNGSGLNVSDLATTTTALYIGFDGGWLARFRYAGSILDVVNDLTGTPSFQSAAGIQVAASSGATFAEDRLYVGTLYTAAAPATWGVYVSSDGGGSFARKVNGLDSSSFSIAVDPNDRNHALFGTMNGGLFETLDAGDNWSNVSTNIKATGSYGFADDPNDAMHILFSSTAGYDPTSKVFETQDSAVSWAEVATLDMQSVMSLHLSSANSLSLLAGTFADGMYKSTNGTAGPWQQVVIPVSNISIDVITEDSQDPTRIYAITEQLTKPAPADEMGLYVTSNSGDSWTRMIPQAVVDFAVHPTTGEEAVAVYGSEVYATTDSFASQTPLGLETLAGGNALTSVAFDPNNPSTVLVGTYSGELYVTTNYAPTGCQWTEVANPSVAVLLTNIAIQRIGGKDMWYVAAWIGDTANTSASTPGIMRSYDQGANWEFLDKGLYPSQLTWKFRASRAAAGRFYAGMWGGGFMQFVE